MSDERLNKVLQDENRPPEVIRSPLKNKPGNSRGGSYAVKKEIERLETHG